jgi:hypothetical protein
MDTDVENIRKKYSVDEIKITKPFQLVRKERFYTKRSPALISGSVPKDISTTRQQLYSEYNTKRQKASYTLEKVYGIGGLLLGAGSVAALGGLGYFGLSQNEVTRLGKAYNSSLEKLNRLGERYRSLITNRNNTGNTYHCMPNSNR